MSSPRRRRFFYGWTLAGVAAFVMVIGTVPLFQGMTAWFVVLQNHFGWTSTQLSIAFSLSRVEGSIMGPISGYLIDKLGSRRMVFIGLAVAGGGFVAMSRMTHIWHFYAAFMVMSMGVGLGTWMPMMTVLNNWFVRNRSTAMALAMEGFLVGGMLLVPLLAFAIDPDVPGRPGWRNTALAIGLFLVAVSLPLSRLVRNSPEPYGQYPDGDAAAARARQSAAPGSASDEPDYTWQEAIRTKNFWLITMGHACSSIVIVTITVHLGPMLDDRGFSLQTVGWVVGAYTGVATVFTLVGGYAGDRMPIRLALFGFSAVQSAAVLALLLAETLPMAYLFAALMGIGFGGRNPLTTAIRGVYFGRKAFASITGMSMIPMNVLLLAAPLFAGIMFDATGSYTIPMAVVAIVSLAGSTLFLFLGSPQAVARRMPIDERNEARYGGEQDTRPGLRWPKTYRRMGWCPKCQCRIRIDRPSFPVLRCVAFLSLTFLPMLFVGITSGWFFIGFAIWRKSKATCAICGGEGIGFKAGRDTEGLWLDAAIILMVIWTVVSAPLLLLDLARLTQFSALG